MAKPGYVIVTDSDSELPLSLAQRYEVPFVRMPYILEGVEYFYDLGENTDFKGFFDTVRQGSLPTTNTYPPSFYADLWRPYLEQGLDVMHICFSSKLSSTFSFMEVALQEIGPEFPDRRIELVDTKAISGGMAVLVKGAIELRDAGASIDDVLAWLNENIPRACHLFMVDDLNHLRRGGRIPASSAIVGSILNVKPLLNLDDEGYIRPFDKVMGRNKALRALADLTIAKAYKPEENALILLHGDCEEDGQKLLAMVQEQITFKEVFFQFIGPVIGTHAGPGTLGICFLADKR